MYDLDYEEEMELAEAGEPEAMFNVASWIIWSDQNSPVDPEMAELALKYYKANAAEGDTDSMLDLGGMYLTGRGVEKDAEKAKYWYEKAAALDGVRACRCIGNLYRYDVADDGTPVLNSDPERLAKALEWYIIGSERGEENCIYELGDYYRDGIIVPKNEEKALDLYLEAYRICKDLKKERFVINDSYADVCLRLAECYHNGIGTEKNLSRARFYIKAAEREAKERLLSGDGYGKVVYEAVRKEYESLMDEAVT